MHKGNELKGQNVPRPAAVDKKTKLTKQGESEVLRNTKTGGRERNSLALSAFSCLVQVSRCTDPLDLDYSTRLLETVCSTM